MIEYGRFIPSHFPFPDLGKCRFLYYSLKLSKFSWGFPHQVLRCAIHSQSGAASQCEIAMIFEEGEAQLVRPWHFLFLLLRVSCSGPAVNRQQRKRSSASAERARLHLQDVLQADVSPSRPARIHVAALTGSWAPFRRVTTIIRGPARLSALSASSMVLTCSACEYPVDELNTLNTLCGWRVVRKLWDWW